MGKIADSYVEIGAKPTGFEAWVDSVQDKMDKTSTSISSKFKSAADLISQYSEQIIDGITGIEGAGAAVTMMIDALGSVMATKFALVVSSIAAVTVALDELYSRTADQTFAESVSGWTSGFRGLNEQIEQTDKRIKAIMENDATGGGGGWLSISSWKALIARISPVESMTSQIARNMDNAVTASALFAQNMERSAVAHQQQKDQRVGAQMMAGMFKTGNIQEQENLNERAFKNIMDRQGSAAISEQLLQFFRNNPNFLAPGQAPREAAQITGGALARGDVATTQLFEKSLGISAERAKILADDFEKATGAAAELAAIERQAIQKAQSKRLGEEFEKATGAAAELAAIENAAWRKKLADDFEKATGAAAELAAIEKDRLEKQRQFEQAQVKRQEQETQKAAQDMQRLQEQQDALAERRVAFEQARNERQFNAANFQDLASARDNLFLAAKQDEKDKLTEKGLEKETDRVVKALDKIYEKFNMKMN